MYEILDKQVLATGIVRFSVKAPLIARKRRPGNFVIVRATMTGERIPLTIVESDEQSGAITLIVQAIGKTTQMINQMEPGEQFTDVVGPLGQPTPVIRSGTVVCIGGGVGAAVIYPMAEALSRAGNRVIGIIGARRKDLVILEQEMDQACDELIVATDDGSYNRKGMVTDALAFYTGSDRQPDSVYVAGPLAMMQAVAEMTRKPGIRTYASLNPIMMDGTGMCGACRVSVDDTLKFACVDGPEFDAHAVNFEELRARNRTYTDLEEQAAEQFFRQLENIEVNDNEQR